MRCIRLIMAGSPRYTTKSAHTVCLVAQMARMPPIGGFPVGVDPEGFQPVQARPATGLGQQLSTRLLPWRCRRAALQVEHADRQRRPKPLPNPVCRSSSRQRSTPGSNAPPHRREPTLRPTCAHPDLRRGQTISGWYALRHRPVSTSAWQTGRCTASARTTRSRCGVKTTA